MLEISSSHAKLKPGYLNGYIFCNSFPKAIKNDSNSFSLKPISAFYIELINIILILYIYKSEQVQENFKEWSLVEVLFVQFVLLSQNDYYCL